MPVAAAVMIYGGGTALAAGATGWAAFAAGAMVVGGATSLVGTITGDKKLERDGMIIGGIGSLGYGALELGGYAGTASNVQNATAAADAAQTGNSAASPVDMYGRPTTTGAAAQPGVVATPEPSIMQAIEASNTKFTMAMQKMQTQNMIAQVAGGVGQAYSAREQAKTEEGIVNRQMAEAAADKNRQITNINAIPKLTIPTPQLPNFGAAYGKQLKKP